MYKPLFNHVLVEVDDREAAWGKGNNESLGGEAYREGKVIEIGPYVKVADHDLDAEWREYISHKFDELDGKHVMWNEGHEAGKTFEEDGKLYALIYWWDIVGVKDEQ